MDASLKPMAGHVISEYSPDLTSPFLIFLPFQLFLLPLYPHPLALSVLLASIAQSS